jgi:hypothetical protein
MKSSNLVTILSLMLLVLILRTCNVFESVSRKSIGIGAIAFTLVILLVILVEYLSSKK